MENTATDPATQPAPQPVNKEAFKVLALTIGIREAARQTGIKEGTALQWAKRGGWTKQLDEAKQRAAMTRQSLQMMPKPDTSSNVITAPAAAAANVLAELGNATRLAGAKAVRNALEHAANLDGESALAASRNVKDAIGGAAQLHGWGAGDGGPTQINILGGQNVIQPQMRE
jgi:hypothetical protein